MHTCRALTSVQKRLSAAAPIIASTNANTGSARRLSNSPLRKNSLTPSTTLMEVRIIAACLRRIAIACACFTEELILVHAQTPTKSTMTAAAATQEKMVTSNEVRG